MGLHLYLCVCVCVCVYMYIHMHTHLCIFYLLPTLSKSLQKLVEVSKILRYNSIVSYYNLLQNVNTLEEGNRRFLGCNEHPFLEAHFISSFHIPRNSKEPNPSYTHNSHHLIGFQAHLMAHLTMANASAHLSHYSTETMMYTQETC